MALSKIIHRAIVLDQLIKQKRTGTANDLAKTLGISRRHVYHYLEAFHEMGKSATYHPELCSFVYETDLDKIRTLLALGYRL